MIPCKHYWDTSYSSIPGPQTKPSKHQETAEEERKFERKREKKKKKEREKERGRKNEKRRG